MGAKPSNVILTQDIFLTSLRPDLHNILQVNYFCVKLMTISPHVIKENTGKTTGCHEKKR